MLAARMNKISASPTSQLIGQVAEMRRNGVDVISLNIGEPDFGTPDNIRVAGVKAIADNFTKYTPAPGIADLREAIVAKLKEDNHINYNINEICVTVGAKQAVFNAIMTTCDYGDEVLLPIPCWVSYTEMIKLAGAKPVFVQLNEEEGFALDITAIKRAITPKTKAIVICTPNNPSGAVYSKESLEQLAKLACEHNFYIIADEVYEKIIYDGEKHFSIASISQEVRDRTITINGVSKTYAMTGWRIGYAASCREIINGIKAIQSQTTSGACSISQKAAIAAIIGSQLDLNNMVEEFDRRRRYVTDRINAIDGVHCATPKGAFYLLPDVSSYLGKSYGGTTINNAIDLAAFLLDKAQIALVPGEAFNAPGKIRISYSNSMENLAKAIDRMEEALLLLK